MLAQTLKLKFSGTRNRLLQDPGFQRFSLKLWPTRWVARRQASQLFDICSGFVYSQILSAAIELGVLDLLADGPLSVSRIAEKTELDVAIAHRLLRASTALELTEYLGPGEHTDKGSPDDSQSLYALGKLGAAVLGNPGLIQLMQHHRMFYKDLQDPVALLKGQQSGTQLGAYWAYARNDGCAPGELAADAVQDYSQLMAVSQPMVSELILDAYAIERHRCLLDLGGGTGAFLNAVQKRAPALQLQLFDLPGVIENSSFDHASNINTFQGDFFEDPFPGEADIISLVRILHDHNDDAVQALLAKVFDTLPAGGTLLIGEPLSDTRGAKRIGDAYFNFYFLAMGKGNPRSFNTLKTMLLTAGFKQVQNHHSSLPLVCSVLSAVKPSLD